jgi:hypothetical protein
MRKKFFFVFSVVFLAFFAISNNAVSLNYTQNFTASDILADLNFSDSISLNTGFQIKWNISSLPEHVIFETSSLCVYWSNVLGSPTGNARISRIANQSWDESSNPITIKSQNLTNQTDTSWDSIIQGTYGCLNPTNTTQECLNQNENNCSIRIEDPLFLAPTIDNVDNLDEMSVGSFSTLTVLSPYSWTGLYPPYMTVTYVPDYSVSECQDIIFSGGTYNLTKDVTSKGESCFRINGSSLTLDCKGYTISGLDNFIQDESFELNSSNWTEIENQGGDANRYYNGGAYLTDFGGIDDNNHSGLTNTSGPTGENSYAKLEQQLIQQKVYDLNLSNNLKWHVYIKDVAEDGYYRGELVVESLEGRRLHYYYALDGVMTPMGNSTDLYITIEPASTTNGTWLNYSRSFYSDWVDTKSLPETDTVSKITLTSFGYNPFMSMVFYGQTMLWDYIEFEASTSGIEITNATEVTVRNCRIENFSKAINFRNSSQSIIIDSYLNSTLYDVNSEFPESNNTLLNTTLYGVKPVNVSGGIVYFNWYADFYVKTVSGSPINGSNVSVWDIDGTLIFSELTNSSGYTGRKNLTQYYKNSSNEYSFTPHTAEANKTDYVNDSEIIDLEGSVLVELTLSRSPIVYRPETYSPAMVKKSAFKPGQTVRVRVQVTDADGGDNIDDVLMTVRNSTGGIVLNPAPMINVTNVSNGYIYEYNYSIPQNAQNGIWTINVTANDTLNNKASNNVSIAVLPVTMRVRIFLSNTNTSKVYIPGYGEHNASDLNDTEYTSGLSDYYIVSYENNVLSGLVFSHQKFTSVSTNKSADYSEYTLGMDQELSNSRVFLVFSKGDWNVVNKRMDLIESGTFLSNIAPSFSYGLGSKVKFKVAIEYDNIDVLNDTSAARGYYRFVFGNEGLSGSKVGLSVKRI